MINVQMAKGSNVGLRGGHQDNMQRIALILSTYDHRPVKIRHPVFVTYSDFRRILLMRLGRCGSRAECRLRGV